MNRWALLPFIVIAIALIPNLAFVIIARQARPTLVEASPWLATRSEDHRQAARLAFTAAGWRFSASTTATQVLVNVDTGRGDGVETTPRPEGTLMLQRPDDSSADRAVPWPRGATSAALNLRPGRWHIEWVSADRSRSARVSVDAPRL